jgi:hypothetical protein
VTIWVFFSILSSLTLKQLHKKHLAISYHIRCESCTAHIIELFYIPLNQNYADPLMKQLPVPAFQYHFKGLLYDFRTEGACDIDPDVWVSCWLLSLFIPLVFVCSLKCTEEAGGQILGVCPSSSLLLQHRHSLCRHSFTWMNYDVAVWWQTDTHQWSGIFLIFLAVAMFW